MFFIFNIDIKSIVYVRFHHLKMKSHLLIVSVGYTGELGYDGPLYDGSLHMTDDMLGPSPMHIKYSSYV